MKAETEEKINTLKYIITRYDHYYDAVNHKGNVYLSVMIFLIGGTIAGFHSINSTTHCDFWAWFFFYITIIIQLAGIAVTLLAINPFLKSGTKKLDGSIIYFGDVASLTIDEYKAVMEGRTDQTMYDDFLKQAHLLSKGLRVKYRLLRWSTLLIALEIFFIVIIGLIIFK